jgi:tripartite-type tricarboxylate transporter receptor subunit TctC
MTMFAKLGAAAALTAALAIAPITSALAQKGPEGFPSKPVELLTYTDPGTSIDLTLRALAPLLSADIGQPTVVVNRPGGNGTNAMTYLTRRPADGYTLYGHTTTFSSVMAQKVGGFTGEEVDYLCAMVAEPMAVTVRADSPFKDIAELVAFAKANPGKLRASGGAGAGSYPRLFAMAFQEKAGVEITWVPFDSSPEGRRALLGGDLDLLFTSVGAVEGARMLAITSAKRFSYAPDTPTLAEAGFDIGDRVAWRGLMVRAGTPEPVKAYLIEALKRAAAKPEWEKFLTSIGAGGTMLCGDDFAKAARAEIEETKVWYKKLGIID